MEIINNIKYLSQRDFRWGNLPIGKSSFLVKDFGCTLTCLSMISQYFGCYRSPEEISKMDIFDSGGRMIWTKLNFPTFSFRWCEGSSTGSSNADMEMIKSYMVDGIKGAKDRALLIKIRVYLPKGGSYEHFVVGLWPTFDGDIHIIDPWDAQSKDLIKTYGNSIVQGYLFTRWNKTQHEGKEAWQGQGKPLAPKYN